MNSFQQPNEMDTNSLCFTNEESQTKKAQVTWFSHTANKWQQLGLEPGQRAPRIQSSIRLLDLTEPFLPLLLSELPPLSSSDVDILELPEPQDGGGCVDRWPAGRLPWNTAPGSLAREAALGPALLLPHYGPWPFLGSFTL